MSVDVSFWSKEERDWSNYHGQCANASSCRLSWYSSRLCIADQARASLWTMALNNYRTAMILLRKRDDFTNTEIVTYQQRAGRFFHAWVKLWQKEGIANYIHMIWLGHIANYLYKWRNLYRYSQQGWEAMNLFVKTFYLCQINHRVEWEAAARNLGWFPLHDGYSGGLSSSAGQPRAVLVSILSWMLCQKYS